MGVENVWNKFLLSPLEAKRFIEEVGSEYIGVYFDVGNFVPWAFPEQWIEMLGKRHQEGALQGLHAARGTSSCRCWKATWTGPR